MNREILFKGFHADARGSDMIFLNGEQIIGFWCEGNLVKNKLGTSVITPDETPIGLYGQVIPKTVCQFTGLTDKNGVKIFENDIVKSVDGSVKVGIVTFGRGTFASGIYKYYGWFVKGPSGNIDEVPLIEFSIDKNNVPSGYEIVGNIFNNKIKELKDD